MNLVVLIETGYNQTDTPNLPVLTLSAANKSRAEVSPNYSCSPMATQNFDNPLDGTDAGMATLHCSDSLGWGVGAIAIGGVMLLVCPMVLILSVGIWEFSDQSSNVVLFHAWLARVSVGLLSTLCIAGNFIAIKAFRIRRQANSPSGIPIAGLMLSTTASLLWVIAAVALLNTTESMVLIYVQ